MTNTVQFGVSGPDDGFLVALRRRGWHHTELAPVYNDPKVIRWRVPYSSAVDERESRGFYDAFGDTTLRKVLRAIFGSESPPTEEQLRRICDNEKRLADILSYLEKGGFIEARNGAWIKGPECRHIDNIGTTLEWYVAEWFRRELQAAARHGVILEDAPEGGDLDVIAFFNETCVFVECKTGKPDDLKERDIRLFLQRAHVFGPDIAILLIDSKSPLTRPIQLVAKVTLELNWLSSHPEASVVPAEFRPTPSIEELVRELTVSGHKEMYRYGNNTFLTGVQVSVDASLSSVLRYYHAYLRHQLIFPAPPEWDFVAGTIRGRGE